MASREILLGGGIKGTQATASGVIWSSYFDEGIFGNYGWHDPIGASGLVARDTTGDTLYQYAPTDALDDMADCYAMNVPRSVRFGATTTPNFHWYKSVIFR
jgi:hypothetical protein